MNIFHNVLPLAAFGLLAFPSFAFAREAQMLNFSTATRAAITNDTALPNFEPIGVEEVLDAHVPLSTTVAPPKVDVPVWMRRPSVTSITITVPTIPVNLLKNCEGASYRPNVRLSMEAERRRSQYYPLVMAIACEAGVPGPLFDALISQESRYNPAAFSPKGAAGLTQLMPDTAARLGVSNRLDVLQNLRGGARYLRMQLDEFGRYDLALGAYNAGPGRIRQYKSIPPFRETLLYVRTILSDVRAALFGSTFHDLGRQPAGIRTANFMVF